MRKLLSLVVLTLLAVPTWAATARTAPNRKFTLSFSRSTLGTDTALDTASLTDASHQGESFASRSRAFWDEYLGQGSGLGFWYDDKSRFQLVWGYNIRGDYAVGDSFTLYSKRAVSRERTSGAWSIDSRLLVRGDSLRMTFGYRNSGTIRIREDSSREAFVVREADNRRYDDGFKVSLLAISFDTTTWSSDASITAHTLYVGAEHDLYRSRRLALSVGGGLDSTLYWTRQTVDSSTWVAHESTWTRANPSVGHEEDNPLKRSDPGTVLFYPFASVTGQVWPLRRLGIGAQARWYPGTLSRDSEFASLLEPYTASSNTKRLQFTASATLAF